MPHSPCQRDSSRLRTCASSSDGGKGRGLGFGPGIVVGWRAGVGHCRSRLEGVGELAVSEGCEETFDGDAGHSVVGEIRWFGGDKVWASLDVHKRVSMSHLVNFAESGENNNNDNG